MLFVVQSLSYIQLFVTPWTEVHQPSLSFTISWSLLKLMSIELVMPSSYLIHCHPLLSPSIFPSIRVFSNDSVFLHQVAQSIGVSASASVLPVNIQDRFPLGWIDWISLLSKGLSRIFSNTTVQKHRFFCAQPLFRFCFAQQRKENLILSIPRADECFLQKARIENG